MNERDEIILKATLQDPELTYGALDILCGEYLGGGQYRDVFELKFNTKDFVVKIETLKYRRFNNVKEWEIWQLVEGYQGEAEENITSWFAPCEQISNNGRILIQRRTKDFYIKEDKLPEKIPNFFTDVKPENFGWIGNKLVCHDYADVLLRLGFLGFKNKMRDAKKAFFG